MGTKTAQDFIRNVRTNLNEALSDTDILVAGSGNKWTNTELLECVNKGKNRCWDIVRTVREDYFITLSASLSINSSAKEYALPAGFRQLAGIKCTTSGFEYLAFRSVEMSDDEFKSNDAISTTVSGNSSIAELLYVIVGNAKIKFANFPPGSLTLSYDYIGSIADFPLDASATAEINDELRDYIEAYATRQALTKFPGDARLPFWDGELRRLEPIVISNVSHRQLRDPQFVEAYDPY